MNPQSVNQFITGLQAAFHDGDSESHAKQTEANNVRCLQEQYQTIAQGNLDGFRDTLTDDIEMEIIGPPGTPLVGRWKGREQVMAAVIENFSLLEDQRPEIQAVIAQGDTVVVFARERGFYRPTGKTYDVHWVQFLTFRNGKIARFREMFDSGMVGKVEKV